MVATEQTINETIEREYKEYAMYVITSRAIPSMVDGMKTVQRKILCAALDAPKNKRIKVAELGGALSSYNYHHGESSAQDAVITMARDWGNNAPLLEAHGNFGSRLVPDAAAPRYIFTKLSEHYHQWFCDSNIAPPTEDPEGPEPLHYLPKIPWVLVNGSRGIAVGFAVNILPRDPREVSKACAKVLRGVKNIKRIPPSYPNFTGTWEYDTTNEKWIASGVIKKIPRGYEISEVPPGVDREKYVVHLNKLVEDKKIKDFDDNCGKSFNFTVYATPAQKKVLDKTLRKTFKLEASFTENFSVLDHKGDLRVFSNEIELIREFCNYRLKMYEERLKNDVKILESDIKEHREMLNFIKGINKNRKIALDKGRDYLLKRAETHSDCKEMQNRMVNTPIYKFCSETITEHSKKVEEYEQELVRLKNLDAGQVFVEELTK